MDFDWFYYVGTTLLNMSEESFWRSTPKKVSTLYEIHRSYNGLDEDEEGNDTEKVYCIDEVPFL